MQVYPLEGKLASALFPETAVIEDENVPLKAKKPKRDLDPMSIEELDDYIAEMHEEIERVRGEIAKKQAHRAGVDALFRKPS